MLEAERLEDHEKAECPKRTVTCSRCLKEMQAEQHDSHVEKACPKRPLQCKLCGKFLRADTMMQHMSTACPKRLVSCPHCSDMLEAAMLKEHQMTAECTRCPAAPEAEKEEEQGEAASQLQQQDAEHSAKVEVKQESQEVADYWPQDDGPDCKDEQDDTEMRGGQEDGERDDEQKDEQDKGSKEINAELLTLARGSIGKRWRGPEPDAPASQPAASDAHIGNAEPLSPASASGHHVATDPMEEFWKDSATATASASGHHVAADPMEEFWKDSRKEPEDHRWTNRKTCKFFEQGICKFGSACKFVHNQNNQNPPEDSRVRPPPPRRSRTPPRRDQRHRNDSRDRDRRHRKDSRDRRRR